MNTAEGHLKYLRRQGIQEVFADEASDETEALTKLDRSANEKR